MRAIRFHEYGGPEVLREEEVPAPEPGPGEVRVRVRAAGVNPFDWKVRAGHFKEMMPIPLPSIPGGDLVGTIDALGAGVEGWSVGDAVFGRGSGCYAEYAVAPADALAAPPRALDEEQAAAAILPSLTAWTALFGINGLPSLELQAGQTILIHGASGSVGGFAVQLAKARGARVVAVDRGDAVDYLRGLGADVVVDYQTQRFEDVSGQVDAVLDLVGGETQQRSWSVLAPGGVLGSAVMPPSAEEAAARGARAFMVTAQSSGAHLAEIAGQIDAGNLHIPSFTVLPLSEARRAHELNQSGKGGKIVLRIG